MLSQIPLLHHYLPPNGDWSVSHSAFMLLLRIDLEMDNWGEALLVRVWVYRQISLLSSSQNIGEADAILLVNNLNFKTQLPRPLYYILLPVNTLPFTAGHFLSGAVCLSHLLNKIVPLLFSLSFHGNRDCSSPIETSEQLKSETCVPMLLVSCQSTTEGAF